MPQASMTQCHQQALQNATNMHCAMHCTCTAHQSTCGQKTVQEDTLMASMHCTPPAGGQLSWAAPQTRWHCVPHSLHQSGASRQPTHTRYPAQPEPHSLNMRIAFANSSYCASVLIDTAPTRTYMSSLFGHTSTASQPTLLHSPVAFCFQAAISEAITTAGARMSPNGTITQQ